MTPFTCCSTFLYVLRPTTVHEKLHAKGEASIAPPPPPQENIQHFKNMKFLHFFLVLGVLF
jgi:hypothetical protein